ncbi:MAG: hypothetical protein BWY69_00305 [Planctomycetes bacterium ADurb.Bin401]|nr:MAG: hypothetical protein BWY69_00305 [Planctomycetes bacterium ADurb.Bin401]
MFGSFFFIIPLLRVPICKGKILGFLRPHVQIFCPPEDLYDPILNKKIEISDTNKVQTYEFKTKYIGHYAAIIVLDGLDDDLYRKAYDLKLNMKLNFYQDGILLISRKTSDYYNKSWGLGHGDGEIKCEFESPKDIPIDANVTCEVLLITIDPYLNKHFKSANLFIQKYSEE